MDIRLAGHMTVYTRLATSATISGVIKYPTWSSTRIGTHTYILQYCWCQGYNYIYFLEICFDDSYRIFSINNMHD